MERKHRGLFCHHGTKKKGECQECGYRGPTQKHHVEGRANSDEWIELCANCHTEIHAGVRRYGAETRIENG